MDFLFSQFPVVFAGGGEQGLASLFFLWFCFVTDSSLAV